MKLVLVLRSLVDSWLSVCLSAWRVGLLPCLGLLDVEEDHPRRMAGQVQV